MSTTPDADTGLPILGGAVNEKKIPIDPKLLPELRDLEEKMVKTDAIAREIGYGLVLTIGTAAGIGLEAAKNRKLWQDYVKKIAALMGVNVDAIKETDPEKGLLILQ